MSQDFGQVYADAYDTLYADKDYAAECDLIERIFHHYSEGDVQSILDLGCGTGNHAIPMAQRGYEVAGVDRSAGMLAHAREKASKLSSELPVSFSEGDIRAIDLDRQFDAVLMMFAVLGYQLENTDVLATLKTAHRHLRPGGLLIFDVWYGPAVLHLRPSQRIKVIPTPRGQTLRVTSGELDTSRHVCAVDYHLWQIEGDRVVAETEESHTVRYFFPRELDLFLAFTDFAPLRLGVFPDFDREPGDTTWNVLSVARAIK